MPGKSYPYSCISGKFLKISGERILGVFFFQSSPRHSRIQTVWNIVLGPFYTDEDIKGHWGKGHVVVTHLHLRASGLPSLFGQ